MLCGERQAVESDSAAERMAIVRLLMAFPRVMAEAAKGLQIARVERQRGDESPRSLVIHHHATRKAPAALRASRIASQVIGAKLAPCRRIVERARLGLGGKINDRHCMSLASRFRDPVMPMSHLSHRPRRLMK